MTETTDRACGETVTLNGLYREMVGRCERHAGHQPPHIFYTDDLHGRPIVIEWDERSSRAHHI